MRRICFSCGVAIVWAVLERGIPPPKRPLASFECFAPPRRPPSGGLQHRGTWGRTWGQVSPLPVKLETWPHVPAGNLIARSQSYLRMTRSSLAICPHGLAAKRRGRWVPSPKGNGQDLTPRALTPRAPVCKSPPKAPERQSISHCEITPCARNALKSGDPSDQSLAFFERAAPPSPLQAGAPACLTPGPLRGPLHHQGRRSGSS